MCTKYQSITLLVSFLSTITIAAPENSSGVDYEPARLLEKRMAGKVENTTLLPVWRPDESALFYQVENTILEVSSTTGEKLPVIHPELLAGFFNGRSPTIPHFTIGENGEFICLAVAGKQISTIKASDKGATLIDAKKNPFALIPKKAGPRTQSGQGNGDTKIYFINNSDETHTIEWISQSRTRRKYATLKPGETHIQNTYADHVFTAGGLAFTATKQPGIAFLASKPEKTPTHKNSSKTQHSPQQNRVAEIRDYNLFVKNIETGKELQLTRDGSKGWKYCGPFLWSHNGHHLIAFKEKAGTGRTINLIKTAPADQLQPKTETIPYAKPGDVLDVKKPCLFDLEEGKAIPLDDTLYADPYHLKQFH